MTGTDWSFSLRSSTGFFDDTDTDDDDGENVGDAGASSRLSSSSSQNLQQIDLAAREDSAQYKPNPWSIAKVNAASRPRQSTATVKSVSEKSVAKKLPEGAIVDAFKRQSKKPKATTNSSAQANQRQTLSNKPAWTPVLNATDNSVSAPGRSHTPTVHITTSAVDPVPDPPQPRISQQHQETLLPSFLPRNAISASYPTKPTFRSPNPHFTPSLKRVQPFSSPIPPPSHPQHSIPSISRPRTTPPQTSTSFGPHILEPFAPTPRDMRLTTKPVAPGPSVNQEEGRLVHPSYPDHHPSPAKSERKATLPRLGRNTQSPSHPQPNKPIIKVPPKPVTVPPSPFAQPRQFFGQGRTPVTTIKQPSSNSDPLLKEESHHALESSHPRMTSPMREYVDPYDQLPPSPDSEWSTLKQPTRMAGGRGKSKALDVKSGKFRLPLSFGTLTPKEPPQKKARVVTYLPPPPPKKQKVVAELPPGTQEVETGICANGPPLSPR